MLVVIAIIAILVAIIIPTVTNATEKAKQATDVANIRSYVAQVQIETLEYDLASCPSLPKLITVSGGTISSINDGVAKTTMPNNLGKSSIAHYAAVYTPADQKVTITYTSTLLKEGNGGDNDKNTYVWEIASMNTYIGSTVGP